jgi:hypothetical protein
MRLLLRYFATFNPCVRTPRRAGTPDWRPPCSSPVPSSSLCWFFARASRGWVGKTQAQAGRRDISRRRAATSPSSGDAADRGFPGRSSHHLIVQVVGQFDPSP